MVFVKGMKATKGFTGKKHSEYSKQMMSEGRKIGWMRKRGYAICFVCGEFEQHEAEHCPDRMKVTKPKAIVGWRFPTDDQMARNKFREKLRIKTGAIERRRGGEIDGKA